MYTPGERGRLATFSESSMDDDSELLIALKIQRNANHAFLFLILKDYAKLLFLKEKNITRFIL